MFWEVFGLFRLRSGFRVLLGGIRFGSSLLLHYLVFLLLSRLRLTFVGLVPVLRREGKVGI